MSDVCSDVTRLSRPNNATNHRNPAAGTNKRLPFAGQDESQKTSAMQAAILR
jgi:hypothetical protein